MSSTVSTEIARSRSRMRGSAGIDHALRLAMVHGAPHVYDWARLDGPVLLQAVVEACQRPDESVSYLLLACLERRIPLESDVVEFTREWRVSGLRAPLQSLCRTRRVRAGGPVRVETGEVVDVTDTGRSKYTTGIQRVARETLTRWAADGAFIPVSWTPDGSRLLDSTPKEIARAVLEPRFRSRVARASGAMVVPFGGTLILPEIAVSGPRSASLRTIARYARVRSVAIGFDCIPITTAETSGPGMPGAFSKYLSTLAEFDAVATISSASTTEYRGWKAMLRGAGLEGPAIVEVELPSQAPRVDDALVEETARELGLVDQTVVLAVGSHEPRKNHLNLLLAAELNWRAGREFSLVMVGGNAWGDDEFKKFVKELRRKGRRITLLSGVDDEVVWSLYRLARFSVFCSVNEGFGLPVVESLALGTPVLTSDFGSMRELGDGHGALVVDPQDPRAMSKAIRSLLDDDDLIASLRDRGAGLVRPTWDDYATALRAVVVGG